MDFSSRHILYHPAHSNVDSGSLLRSGGNQGGGVVVGAARQQLSTAIAASSGTSCSGSVRRGAAGWAAGGIGTTAVPRPSKPCTAQQPAPPRPVQHSSRHHAAHDARPLHERDAVQLDVRQVHAAQGSVVVHAHLCVHVGGQGAVQGGAVWGDGRRPGVRAAWSWGGGAGACRCRWCRAPAVSVAAPTALPAAHPASLPAPRPTAPKSSRSPPPPWLRTSRRF